MGQVRGRGPALLAGARQAMVLPEVWIHKCRSETKRLRSHGEVDSERGLPRAALLRDQRHGIYFDHSMFRAISCRFLEDSILITLRESRGSYSPAAFLPGTHLWATSNPSHAERAFSRSSGGSSLVAWRNVSITLSGCRPSSESGGDPSACRSVREGRSACGRIRSCGPSGRPGGREDGAGEVPAMPTSSSLDGPFDLFS